MSKNEKGRIPTLEKKEETRPKTRTFDLQTKISLQTKNLSSLGGRHSNMQESFRIAECSKTFSLM
jgi:hypothetical protein